MSSLIDLSLSYPWRPTNNHSMDITEFLVHLQRKYEYANPGKKPSVDEFITYVTSDHALFGNRDIIVMVKS